MVLPCPPTPRIRQIPRTGEPQLHETGNMLGRHAHRPFYATEKLDGFSMSFGILDGDFVLSARERMIAPYEVSVFAMASGELEIEDRLGAVPDVLFQGELIGPGIRGNRYRLEGLQVHVFNAIRRGQFVSFAELQSLCLSIDLPMVPLLSVGFHPTPENTLELASGHSTINSTAEREGAVFRPLRETWDNYQGRVSFKVFNPNPGFVAIR